MVVPWARCTHTFGYGEDRIVHWYDLNTGEICDPLDCGGGRAPPRTNVPGCPGYTGTLTRATEASFMPSFTSAKPPPAPAAETTVGSSSASGSGPVTTAPPTTLSSSTRSSITSNTSSTTSEPVKGAGSRVLGGSWAVVAAGVVLGALVV